MDEVVAPTGVRTATRISHCFVLDVPGYAKALIVSGAAVNIPPSLEEKADIVQNAIVLAQALAFDGARAAFVCAADPLTDTVSVTAAASGASASASDSDARVT